MKKTKGILTSFLIAGILLTGCSETNKTATEDNLQSNGVITAQEMTVHIEDKIKSENSTFYVFNGFIGEDTLSFETPDGYRSISSFHPATIGYRFKLRDLKDYQFEVIDFSRENGYVKLKVTIEN